jgi:hypothetical protein
MVGSSIDKDTIDLLKKFYNRVIQIKKIIKIDNPNQTQQIILTKFECLNLIEYEKIIYMLFVINYFHSLIFILNSHQTVCFLNKIELIEIEDKKFIFNKVLVGDKGDCVPSVWEMKKGEKIQNFTQKKSDIVMESFVSSKWYNEEIIDIIEDPDFLSWISGFILRISKDIDSEENRDKVTKNLIRNFNLI